MNESSECKFAVLFVCLDEHVIAEWALSAGHSRPVRRTGVDAESTSQQRSTEKRLISLSAKRRNHPRKCVRMQSHPHSGGRRTFTLGRTRRHAHESSRVHVRRLFCLLSGISRTSATSPLCSGAATSLQPLSRRIARITLTLGMVADCSMSMVILVFGTMTQELQIKRQHAVCAERIEKAFSRFFALLWQSVQIYALMTTVVSNYRRTKLFIFLLVAFRSHCFVAVSSFFSVFRIGIFHFLQWR